VAAASKEAFEQGQMVCRLSVRAFDADDKLLPGRIALDAAGNQLGSGQFGALEFKLSINAPYTARQAEHFSMLEKYGGVVVGDNGRTIGLSAGEILAPFKPVRVNGPSLPTKGSWWKN
jgi:hypothetical protein